MRPRPGWPWAFAAAVVLLVAAGSQALRRLRAERSQLSPAPTLGGFPGSHLKSGASPPSAGQRLYRGRVLDAAGAPVQSFQVGLEVVRAKDGRFELLLSPSNGLVHFTVEAPPLANASVSRRQDAAELGDIVLVPAPLVRGVVQEADGGPAAEAVVVCEGCRGESASPNERHLSAETDALGRFALPLVSSHGVLVRLLARKERRLGWAEAGRAGEEARLTLGMPTQVHGRVLRPDGEAAAGVTVQFSEPLLEPRLLLSGQDGTFAGDISPGLYQVTLHPDDATPGRMWTVQVPTTRPLELTTGGVPP